MCPSYGVSGGKNNEEESMSDIFNYAVSQVNRSRRAFCRFITANDVNRTSHQAGFMFRKKRNLYCLMFQGNVVQTKIDLSRFVGRMI